jgi:acyl-CoA synthetase (AMP-forming)/AMP-acid ligase II
VQEVDLRWALPLGNVLKSFRQLGEIMIGNSHLLNQFLDRSAATRPEHIAVEEAGHTITYGDLTTLTDGVRDELRRSGVRPGDRVGIYLHKSIDAVAAIFGILKAGAAYVPVDPLAPASRNAFIFNNCSVRTAIVEDRFIDTTA